jgi:transposase InsO family protein
LQFRARFQVDLVDYRHDAQLNHNGVKMRWLLVTKDHFTKKCWLRPIAFKRAGLVAQELYTLFCDIGWPLIFQSDNGKEFTAKVVTALLKLNPFVITVLGRARKPSDQGSVERLNQQIKRAVCSAIEDLKMKSNDKDYDPSWLEVLPRVAAALNNTVSSGSGLITPYMHVFGVDYDCPVISQIGLPEQSKITTVKQLIEYGSHDPVLMESLRQQQYYPE